MSGSQSNPPFIERAYRVRLRLHRDQAYTLNRLFGASRHVWNWALEQRTRAYQDRDEKLNWIGLSRMLTQYRAAPGTEWLSTLPREPFNQVLRDQERAFANFFAKRAKYPRFRWRGAHDRVRYTLDQRRTQVDRTAGTVDLPGLGTIRFKNSYAEMPGRLRSVTLSRNGAGQYYAAFTADRVPAPAVIAHSVEAVGVDLGLSALATLSTGERIAAPKALAKKLVKLRRYQRAMSRKRDVQLRALGLDSNKPIPKGTRLPVSNRARYLRQRIGRLHTRIRDTRQNAIHQFTAKLAQIHGVICLEDLSVKGMARAMGRCAFRRSVADASLGEFRRQIEYKAGWHQRIVSAVDRFYPSSKTCSVCDCVNQDLQLSERRWTCSSCGVKHDRDLNAARNILTAGLRLLSATPRSGGCEARGVAKDNVAEFPPLRQSSTANREPVKRRRPAPSSHASRRERRNVGT